MRGSRCSWPAISWELPFFAGIPRPGVHRHTGSIAATLEPGADVVLGALRSARPTSTISYDPNVRPSLMGSPQDVRDRIELLVSLADVVKAPEEDLAWLSPDIGVEGVLSRWSQAGPRVCVVTQGRDAVVVFVGQTQQRYSTRPTTVVDTVGAGDSFMAGLISGLLDRGLLRGAAARKRLYAATLTEVELAVSRALACAAITVSRPGADPPLRAEL